MTAKNAAVEAVSAANTLAFSVAQLATATGLSTRQIYKHIDRGDIVPKFSGTKKLVPTEEARRFIRELPEEEWEL